MTNAQAATIHFVRHAETLFNVNRQLQGWCDAPLTERGERQISALGERMRSVPLVAAFMSDLTRTRTTAAAALIGHPMIDPVPMPELREWHYGSFEGQPNASLWEKVFNDHGFTYRPGSPDWPAMTIDGMDSVIDSIHRHDPSGRAENAATVSARITVALERIWLASQHGDVLVVTHGSVLGSLLRELLPEHAMPAGFPNCGVISVRDGATTPVDASCAVD